jgi:predicted nucleotidyltransferase
MARLNSSPRRSGREIRVHLFQFRRFSALLSRGMDIWHNTAMLDAALIERSAKALLAACPAGSRVILFGSRARGDARADSDVDFLVIEPHVRARLTEAARLARIIRPLHIPADIVVIGREEFEDWKDTPNSVFYYAQREGRLIP